MPSLSRIALQNQQAKFGAGKFCQKKTDISRGGNIYITTDYR